MSWKGQTAGVVVIAALLVSGAGSAVAQALTVDQAVQKALERNIGIVGAEAGLDEARSAQYSALAGVLPNASLSEGRSGTWEKKGTRRSVFGTQIFVDPLNDFEQYSTGPTVNASWQVLNLSSLTSVSASRAGVRAAEQRRQAARNDVSYATRQKFYNVVKAIKTSEVNSNALGLARDEERRVRALFEVGSVSKSDLLQAQVRTAQSELDSLVSHNQVIVQRIVLADQMGIPESEMGVVDTSLTTTTQAYDEAQILEEASQNRPDIAASQAEFNAAKAGLRAANFLRLPYVSLAGSATLDPNSNSVTKYLDPAGGSATGSAESDLRYNATVALNWNVFDGFATDARIASARARVLRARSSLEQLQRNLAGEVQQTLLTYREANEGLLVAERALESAEESHKLIEQKYNVGSATILELINAQVQLQRAANDEVSARAAIKVAEAAIARVRGRNE